MELWKFDVPTSTTLISVPHAHCTPFTLPSKGVLTLGVSSVVTLTTNVVFQPECTSRPDDILITPSSNNSPSKFSDLRDPFYASTIPQCYALAATTVIAYMLVIMLLITPRTFLHQGAVVLGRRGFTNGPSGSDAGIGIGGRPWLQKVAALTVAVSLSIATADTFKVAETQYNQGIMDAALLQKQVEDGQELKIIRVISDTFLWLAQAQTLIRLFPRQREKIIIKWTAFALITLDAIFSILNNFVYNGNSRPSSFVDAVPALAYLFQLALSLLYCAWVMYYSLTKRRFAFYHTQMRNICMVALLSLVAILVPVVFFVLDISKPTLAAWGDYVRWVGAAAASVVVWEWVERIEALERNDKKDGVLGREVFDGDEMLDVTPSSKQQSDGKVPKNKDDRGNDGGGTTTGLHGISWPAVSGLGKRYRHRNNGDIEAGTMRPPGAVRTVAKNLTKGLPPLWPTRPPPAVTPVSRTDTASAESTVYAVHYHPISEATGSVDGNTRLAITKQNTLEIAPAPSVHDDTDRIEAPKAIEQLKEEEVLVYPEEAPKPKASHALAKINLFRRKTQDPPLEVSAYRAKTAATVNATAFHGWDVRARIEDFAATQADKYREMTRPAPTTEALNVTVIPAPTRRRNLAKTLEEIEKSEQEERSPLPSSGLTRTPASEFSASPLHSHPSRTNDPYTPNDMGRRSTTQRGAISFVTTAPDGQKSDQLSPGTSEDQRNYAITPISSMGQSLSPISVSGYSDGLPLLSIPAPPRRPRPDQE